MKNIGLMGYEESRRWLEERLRELGARWEELREETAEPALAGECWMSAAELADLAPAQMSNPRQVQRALGQAREELRTVKAALARAAARQARQIPGQLAFAAPDRAA